ncbi:MAG TPA: hypothetical protein VHM64_20840 [Candidatus Binatia bacterium]|nr:hypothetical protein [Candidatus Binatia bacterium]
MEFIKMDDPRLDENFSFMFLFKKGDRVKSKDEPRFKGEITDGVFVGELPASITASTDTYKKGRTLYEIKLNDQHFIVTDNEIEKA